MSKKKPELEDKLIDALDRLVTEHTEGLVKGLSFLGLFLINQQYFDTKKALAQTALSYLLLTSGTELGITTAIGGIALREWFSELKLKLPPPIPPSSDTENVT